MTQEEILQIFKDAGAFLEGHFILTSGLHSPYYIEKFRVLEQPKYTEMLCKEIVRNFNKEKITAVVGPMTGGIILAYETGKQLGTKAFFTERIEGKMKFRRSFKLYPTDRVLIVEDVITTGGSVQEVIEEVNKTGAHIAGLGYLVDRSNGKAKFNVPAKALLTLDVIAYPPDNCPLCRSGSIAIKPGGRDITP
ncbi:MAG: orotate phosphoribosyltransferase [Ignavibacteria bacterium]|jgi:orotate phosphoribosyltransferase